MVDNKKIKAVRRRLLGWYKKHQRDLPWRHTRDPYRILVSEVMLQQTQVGRVIEKYHEFLERFPTVEKLARARASSVITVWKGLGYNRRALFLQKTAKAVVSEHGGQFPQDLDMLKQLPGVGDYTARAILSFAFDQPVPMMDTNHRRFYQRIFFGLDEKKDKELLATGYDVMSPRRAYDWNQGLMDFGSLVCTTRSPLCEECPLRNFCCAYPNILQEGKKTKHQKKQKTRKPFRETDRYFRGRIVDCLREGKQKQDHVRDLFPEIDDDRFEKIVKGLMRDGLVKNKTGGLMLP